MRLWPALPALLALSGAQALELQIPLDCEIGNGCYVQSYMDRDPGPGAVDYTCNPLSYDGHKGVDFRVPTFAALEGGVDVLAAADGTVLGMRDGEPDTGVEGMTAGRDCGNGLVLDHGDGWQTQYCHLARGSLAVQSGARVLAGDRLGRMGFSGRTEFPHLHFSVRRDGIPTDPFDARPGSESCALSDVASLWSPPARRALAYRAGGSVDAGFAPTAPTLAAIRQGDAYDDPDAGSGILAFWARFYGLREGDSLRVILQRPGGRVFARKVVEIPRNRAEYFHFVGGRRPESGWPSGTYEGTATLIRRGRVVDRISAQLEVD